MKNSFGKKLLSAVLAVVMTVTCFTGVFSAYASEQASSDAKYHDDDLAYNFLGWIDMTDTQVFDALLDYADEMMAEYCVNMKGSIKEIDLNYDLSSVNAALATVNNVRQVVKKFGSFGLGTNLIGDAGRLNLGGTLVNYMNTGSDGDVMTRENTSSKDIVRGIFNILYMNGTSYAYKANNSKNVMSGHDNLQRLLNGTFNAGSFESIIIGAIPVTVTENSLYGIIGGLLKLPVGYQQNLVNNIVVHMLKTYVADDLTKDGVNNKVNYNSSKYAFADAAGNDLTIEEWAIDAINKGVLNTLVGVDEQRIFKNSDGSSRFAMNVGDSINDDLYNAFVPIFEHTLLPLFSTISLDFNFVTQFTKMYYSYVNEHETVDASTKAKLDSYWTADRINAWITADYEEIGKYIGGIQTKESTDEHRVYQFPGMAVFDEKNKVTGIADGVTAADVKAAMIELFNSLDRHSSEIDASKLFTNLLYSPVAEALGCETGVLNLNLKDYYLTKHNLCNYFDWSVLPENGTVKGNAYGLLKEMLSFIFPTFNNWAPASATQDVQGIVDEVIASAGNLIKFVGDSACEGIFAGYDVINEANIEEAVLPLIKAILGEVDITKHIHEDEWNKCDDIEGLLYVALAEYLKFALPQYDYSCLAPVVNGKYDVTVADLLPMARDAVAYVMQASVPIIDKNGNRWDVFEKGGTKNGALVDSTTTAFDMLNYVVCYYAEESGIAQLLNLTKYTVNGTTGAAGYESAITRTNTLWQNLDIVINTMFPMLSKWFAVKDGGAISSEAFVMDTLVNGFANIGDPNTSQFGQNNNKGISAILYNLVYMFTDSEIVTRPFLNVAYEFLAKIFNVIIGPRDASDTKGDLIPANSTLSPFTNLVQANVISNKGNDTDSKNPKEGILGIFIARVAENVGAGGLVRGTGVVDTVLPAAAFILKSVNDLVGFMPTLSEHSFAAPKMSFNNMTYAGIASNSALENQFVEIKNDSHGLNRAIFMGGSDTTSQISRYFIRINSAQCLSDSSLSIDLSTRYNKNFDVDSQNAAKIIAPESSAFYKVVGTSSSTGTKQFEVNYSVTDKSGTVLDASLDNLTTKVSFYVTDAVSWYNEVYDSNHWIRSNYYPSQNSAVKFPNSSVEATRTTDQFNWSQSGARKGGLNVTYPVNVILQSTDFSDFNNISFRATSTQSGGLMDHTKTISQVYMFVNGDTANHAVPVFDDKGNVLKLDSTDYYYPDANGGNGLWVQDNASYSENNETLAYTETRTHIAYTAQQVIDKYGADHVVFENGVCKLVTIKFEENRTAVSWGTPVKGVYFTNASASVAQKKTQDFYPIAVQSGYDKLEPGTYAFNVCFFSDSVSKSATAQMNFVVTDTSDKDQATADYNTLNSFQRSYTDNDFANLSAQDAKTFGLTTNDSYYDAMQSVMASTLAVVGKPISSSILTQNESTGTEKVTTVATSTLSTVVGDLAYKQSTTAIPDKECYGLQKDEFGAAASATYYYLDKDGKYPIYSNQKVDATEANFNKEAYVFVNTSTNRVVTDYVAADASKYEVHYRNTVEYAKEWTFKYGDTNPYYETTTEKTGKYLAKQFKYSNAAGEDSTSKKADWAYKYPEVIEINRPNDTKDYRSEYLKKSDLINYLMEVAKENVKAGGAERVYNEVIKDRANLDENNFDMVTYRMMVKAARAAESLVKSSYEQVFTTVTPSDDDENYEVTGTYKFYALNGTADPEKDTLIAETTYPLFLKSLYNNEYEGLASNAVNGVDYYFGKWDVHPDYLNEDKTIKYDWSTEESGVTIGEAIRVYNMFKAQVVHRGYSDNDLAFMKEILCATGDNYVANTYVPNNYDIDALRTYVLGAFNASYTTEVNSKGQTVLTVGSGEVTFTDASAKPKFGALENGKLVNKGDKVYTAESWTRYVDALAKAVVAVQNASTSAGYTECMYNSNDVYDHDLIAIQNTRTALMSAENQLEEAPVASASTVTGKVVAMLDPTNPDVANGAPALAGVTVTVGDQVATTDANGVFSLSLENGTYTAVIHYVYGYDRTVTINVNGADIDAGTITMVPCDYDNNGYINVSDTNIYFDAMDTTNLACGDIDGNGYINVSDTNIYYAFVDISDVRTIYPAVVIG